jgi:hypothetical protein
MVQCCFAPAHSNMAAGGCEWPAGAGSSINDLWKQAPAERLAGSSRSQSRHQIRPSPLSRINRPAVKWARGRVLESPPAAAVATRDREGREGWSAKDIASPHSSVCLSHKGRPGPRNSSRCQPHTQTAFAYISLSICTHIQERVSTCRVGSRPSE